MCLLEREQADERLDQQPRTAFLGRLLMNRDAASPDMSGFGQGCRVSREEENSDDVASSLKKLSAKI